MQLAFAYRFQRIGAEAMELEPPVAGGRVSDLSFCLDSNNYLANCARPWIRSSRQSATTVTRFTGCC